MLTCNGVSCILLSTHRWPIFIVPSCFFFFSLSSRTKMWLQGIFVSWVVSRKWFIMSALIWADRWQTCQDSKTGAAEWKQAETRLLHLYSDVIGPPTPAQWHWIYVHHFCLRTCRNSCCCNSACLRSVLSFCPPTPLSRHLALVKAAISRPQFKCRHHSWRCRLMAFSCSVSVFVWWPLDTVRSLTWHV